MYTLQRWTGGVVFFYIVWHTYTMRFTGTDLHAFPNASFGKVQAELMNPLLLAFLCGGLIAACWHFATASGCSPQSGGSLPARRRGRDFSPYAWGSLR